MFRSFLCKVFGCKYKAKVYSAVIEESQGFDNPEPIDGLEGWTVWKQSQTEIYLIKHNLGMTNPSHQLHLIAKPMNPDIILKIESNNSNQFVISTWLPGDMPAMTALMFCAIQYS